MMRRFILSLAGLTLFALACSPVYAQTGKQKIRAAELKPPAALKLLAFVRKMIRLNAQVDTSFTSEQGDKLSDVLEPLFEKPEISPEETKRTIQTLQSLLNDAQKSALPGIKEMPVSSAPKPGDPSSKPNFNPFYSLAGAAAVDQATRDLRILLDDLERVAPPIKAEPLSFEIKPEQRISVTTFHNDLARKGWNSNEAVLNPGNVNPSQFGRIWHTKLDGQVYGAPLIRSVGDVEQVIAATENNTVYALNGENGEILWQSHLARPLSDTEYNDCINISPLHGITGTPVIDLGRKEVYVCGLTASKLKQYYKIWALDLDTGAVKEGWPVTLKGSYLGTTFDSGQLTQRGALTLVNGWIYLPFSSRCDIGEWHGWIMGVNTRSPQGAQRAFNPTPEASGGGIWGSAGLSADEQGNLYGVTGNGDYNLNKGGKSITEAIMRLGTSKNFAFSYQRKDYYLPANFAQLDQVDADLGGSSAIVFDHPGSVTPHLLFTGGKDGVVYLVNRDYLGGVGGEVQKQRLFGVEGGYTSFIKTTPAYFENAKGVRFLFVTGNDKGKGGAQGVVALKVTLDSNKRSQLKTVWSAGRPLYQPGTAVVSSLGTSNGIVWVIESNKSDDDIGPAGILHAYDASNGREIYRSNRRERRDSLGDARKFSAPTVANGRVYCGTDGVVAYGLIKENKK